MIPFYTQYGNKIANTKAQKKNFIENNLMYRRFTLVALNNFEWINLPEEIKPRYIERSLFYTGSAVFGYDDNIGYFVLPAALQGNLDVYFEPTNWSVIGNGLTKQYNSTNSVLMRNNMFCIPSEYDVRWYAQKISDVYRTVDTNVCAHKMPWVMKARSNRTVLSLKNLWKQINENEPAVFMDDDMRNDGVEVFTTNTPYVIDKLYDYARKLTSDFYELYGYPTTQTEKNERLTMTESEVKVEFSDSGYVGTMFEYRKRACEEINKMFGLNIDVKIQRYRQKSEEFYELERMKLQQQGINTSAMEGGEEDDNTGN